MNQFRYLLLHFYIYVVELYLVTRNSATTSMFYPVQCFTYLPETVLIRLVPRHFHLPR